MTAKLRVALFVAGLAVVFAASWLLGRAFTADDPPAEPPPVPTEHQHGGH